MSTSRHFRSGFSLLADQSEKLIFLIEQRRDRRLPDAMKPSHTSEGERLVTNQKTMAGALGIEPHRVNKWFAATQSIHMDHLIALSRIFKVEVNHLIHWDFRRFKEKYSSQGSGWTSMLATLEPMPGKILLADPWTSSRHPVFDKAGTTRTVVRAGQPFWCAVRSPIGADEKPAWADWHAFFFSLSLETDEILSLYGPLLTQYGKGSVRYPNSGDLYFPWSDKSKSPVMRAAVEDAGKDFDLVCLLASQQAPKDLLDCARREVAIDLSQMVAPAAIRQEVAVAISSYRVIDGRREM